MKSDSNRLILLRTMNRSIDLPFDINKNMSRGTDNHPVGMENRFGRGEWTFHERFRIVNFPPVSVVGFLETTWKIRKEERKKNYCIKLLFASGAKFGRWRRSTVGRKKKKLSRYIIQHFLYFIVYFSTIFFFESIWRITNVLWSKFRVFWMVFISRESWLATENTKIEI